MVTVRNMAPKALARCGGVALVWLLACWHAEVLCAREKGPSGCAPSSCSTWAYTFPRAGRRAERSGRSHRTTRRGERQSQDERDGREHPAQKARFSCSFVFLFCNRKGCFEYLGGMSSCASRAGPPGLAGGASR